MLKFLGKVVHLIYNDCDKQVNITPLLWTIFMTDWDTFTAVVVVVVVVQLF